MTQKEIQNLVLNKELYNKIVEYKPLLEQYKIRRFIDPTIRDTLGKLYESVTGDFVGCKSCGAKVYLLIMLQWLYNYEINNKKETIKENGNENKRGRGNPNFKKK